MGTPIMGTPNPMGILKRELKRETPTVGTPIPMGDPKREPKWGTRVGTLTPVWDPKRELKWGTPKVENPAPVLGS